MPGYEVISPDDIVSVKKPSTAAGFDVISPDDVITGSPQQQEAYNEVNARLQADPSARVFSGAAGSRGDQKAVMGISTSSGATAAAQARQNLERAGEGLAQAAAPGHIGSEYLGIGENIANQVTQFGAMTLTAVPNILGSAGAELTDALVNQKMPTLQGIADRFHENLGVQIYQPVTESGQRQVAATNDVLGALPHAVDAIDDATGQRFKTNFPNAYAATQVAGEFAPFLIAGKLAEMTKAKPPAPVGDRGAATPEDYGRFMQTYSAMTGIRDVSEPFKAAAEEYEAAKSANDPVRFAAAKSKVEDLAQQKRAFDETVQGFTAAFGKAQPTKGEINDAIHAMRLQMANGDAPATVNASWTDLTGQKAITDGTAPAEHAPATETVSIPETGIGDPSVSVDDAISAASTEVAGASTKAAAIRARLDKMRAGRPAAPAEAEPTGAVSIDPGTGLPLETVTADIEQGKQDAAALEAAAEQPTSPGAVPPSAAPANPAPVPAPSPVQGQDLPAEPTAPAAEPTDEEKRKDPNNILYVPKLTENEAWRHSPHPRHFLKALGVEDDSAVNNPMNSGFSMFGVGDTDGKMENMIYTSPKLPEDIAHGLAEKARANDLPVTVEPVKGDRYVVTIERPNRREHNGRQKAFQAQTVEYQIGSDHEAVRKTESLDSFRERKVQEAVENTRALTKEEAEAIHDIVEEGEKAKKHNYRYPAWPELLKAAKERAGTAEAAAPAEQTEQAAPAEGSVDRFAKTIRHLGGLSEDEARAVAQAYIDNKLATVDPVSGTVKAKHGGLLDRDTLRTAARNLKEGVGPKPAPAAKKKGKDKGFATPEQEVERVNLMLEIERTKDFDKAKTYEQKRARKKRFEDATKALKKLPPGMLTKHGVDAFRWAGGSISESKIINLEKFSAYDNIQWAKEQGKGPEEAYQAYLELRPEPRLSREYFDHIWDAEPPAGYKEYREERDAEDDLRGQEWRAEQEAVKSGKVKKPRDNTKANAITIASKKVDPAKDDIIVAIAKLGGIKFAEAQREWGSVVKDSAKTLRDHVLKQTQRFGHVFKSDGRPLDKIREALVGWGYLPEGADLKDLEAAIEAATRGDIWKSTAGDLESDLEREAREYEENMLAAVDDDALDQISYDEFTEDEAHAYRLLLQNEIDAVSAEVYLQDDVADLDHEGVQAALDEARDQFWREINEGREHEGAEPGDLEGAGETEPGIERQGAQGGEDNNGAGAAEGKAEGVAPRYEKTEAGDQGVLLNGDRGIGKGKNAKAKGLAGLEDLALFSEPKERQAERDQGDLFGGAPAAAANEMGPAGKEALAAAIQKYRSEPWFNEDQIRQGFDKFYQEGRKGEVYGGTGEDGKLAHAAGVADAEAAPEKAAHGSTAPEHAQVGVDDRELGEIVDEFNKAHEASISEGEPVHHLFDPPAKGERVRLQDKVRVYQAEHGWMTPEEARAQIQKWKANAAKQGETRANADKIVLSLFDYTGEWSKPWEEAGYQVYRFDIQDDPEVGDVHKFSVDHFTEFFSNFEGQDVYAILAATPCTDFAVSGARHFAAKDADGRTVASVKLVHQTLATIEYFKPAVWGLENPVGRIEKLGGLPPWRLSFDPNHLGDPYTKKTLVWGRFNGDLPIAPVDPVEGSKMWAKYGGKSLATKNARSATPEGFAYAFFQANNAVDNPVMAVANKYDRLDRGTLSDALQAGLTEKDIDGIVEDYYYQELDDEGANQALRDAINDKTPPEGPKGGDKPEKPAEKSKIEQELDELSDDDIAAMISQATGKVTDQPAVKAKKEKQIKAAVTSGSKPRTAPSILADAASEIGEGFADSLKALAASFGVDESKLMTFPPNFDANAYAKARPHFQSAWEHFKAAGKGLLEFIKYLSDKLSSLIPGFEQHLAYFLGEMRGKHSFEADMAEMEANTNKGEGNNVKRSGSDLERDSEDPAVKDTMGEEDIQPRPAGDEQRTLQGERDASQEAFEPGRDPLLPRSEALTPGERGNKPVRGDEGRPGPEAGTPGSDDDQRGGDPGDTGPPPESVATDAVEAAARRPVSEAGAGDEIDRDLPQLLPGQREDVRFAERRFSKPTGYGVLYTNGTGTGKTFTGLGILKRFVNKGKDNIIVVAPNEDIIRGWQRAAKSFFGLDLKLLTDTKDNGGSGPVITTYANFGQNPELVKRKWDLVLGDEAHNFSANKDGNSSLASRMLDVITLHPRGAYQRAGLLHPTLSDQIDRINADLKAAREEGSNTKVLEARLNDVYEQQRDAIKNVEADVAASQGEARPRVVFLSATPFAYEKNVDYAEGYLFDFGPKVDSGAYNSGDARERFYMQHFGYRMRYNKLTEPPAEVDRGIMQRQFNTWLKREGVLSGRTLDVAADYDRKFVMVDSEVGRKIDEGLDALRENRRYGGLYSAVMENFNYLQRRYLLEAIKAKEVIPEIKEHLALGRKVVVFHDYNKGGGFNPFDLNYLLSSQEQYSYYPEGSDKPQTVSMAQAAAEFMGENPALVRLPLNDLQAPLVALKRAFPDILVVNGLETKKNRDKAIISFQDDESPHRIIMVQSDAGQAGISLHDTTGKFSRVLFDLGLPTKPVASIQKEGRIYRTGQVSDALFRYLNTGTNWERYAFATTIANRASAAENLALGESARALKDAFIEAFMDSGRWPAGHEGEGRGGKERDRLANNALTEWDRAMSMYFGQRKGRQNHIGTDYFATPEPLGLKMVEWAQIRPGDSVLEPSIGHGAIGRWFPEDAKRRGIEPSMELASRAALVFDGDLVQGRFEDHNIVNKYDAIVMNPPFGSGGKTAIDHLAKAAKHLKEHGRVVALIPTGPAADKKFDKWLYEESVQPVEPIGKLYGDTVYKGDTVEYIPTPAERRRLGLLQARVPATITGPYGEGAGFYIKLKNGQQFGVPTAYLVSLEPTGKREKRAANDMQLVADYRLPGVTFERAGTGAMTRVVVLDKGEGRPQSSRDWTNAGSINDFFDSIKDATVPDRMRPEPEEADAAPSAATGLPPKQPTAPKVDGEVTLGQFTHTKTGEPLYVATIEKRLSDDEYTKANNLAKSLGGYYNSFNKGGAIRGFVFKDIEKRGEFASAILGVKSEGDGVVLNDITSVIPMAVRALGKIIKAGADSLPHLVEIGKEVFGKEGDLNYKSFADRMKEAVGDLWARFKGQMTRVWYDVKKILKDERGMVGPDIGAGEEPQEGPTGLVNRMLTEDLPKIKKQIADYLTIDPVPKLSSLQVEDGRTVGDAAVQHASARIYAPKMVDALLAEVFPDEYRNPGSMAATIDILNKDNILAGFDSFVDRAQEAYEAGDEDLASKWMAAADDVAEKHDLVEYDQEVRAAQDNPEVMGNIRRWKQIINPVFDTLYNEVKRVDPDTEREGRGRHFGTRINLLPGNKAAQWEEFMADPQRPIPTPSVNNYRNVHVKRDMTTLMAKFTGEYSTDARLNLLSVLSHRWNEVTKLRLYADLVKSGAAIPASASREKPESIQGQPAAWIDYDVATQTADGRPTREKVGMWVRKDAVGELRRALNTDQQIPTNPILQWGTKLQLLQIADAITHSKNILSVVTRAQGAGSVWKDVIRKVPGIGTLDALKRISDVAQQVMEDTPAIRKEIAQMAAYGLVRPSYAPTGIQRITRMQQFLHSADTAARVVLWRFHKDLVERGLAKDTPESRRNFINQVGQYNRRLMGPIMQAFRDMGVSPFIVAGRNFNRQGRRWITGDPGVIPTTKQAEFQMRLTNVLGTVLLFTIPAILNMITTGNMGGRSGTPLGAWDLGMENDEKGKHKVIDLLQVVGARRGLRLTGLEPALEGLRTGESVNEITGKAVTNSLQSQLHPWIGPGAAMVYKAATGKQPDMRGRMEAQRIPGGGGLQYLENFRAALEAQNPLVYSLTNPVFRSIGLDQKMHDPYGEEFVKTLLQSPKSAFGIQDKPTAAIQEMQQIFSEHGGVAMTPHEALKSKLKGDLRGQDRETVNGTLQEAVENGYITNYERLKLNKALSKPQIAAVGRFEPEELVRVMSKATPDEMRVLMPIFNRRLNHDHTLSGEEKQGLRDRVRSFLNPDE